MMMHGLSHATAALVSVVAGNMLSERLREWLPTVYETIAAWVGTSIYNNQLPIATTTVMNWLVVILFGFVWGVAFHIARSD